MKAYWINTIVLEAQGYGDNYEEQRWDGAIIFHETNQKARSAFAYWLMYEWGCDYIEAKSYIKRCRLIATNHLPNLTGMIISEDIEYYPEWEKILDDLKYY